MRKSVVVILTSLAVVSGQRTVSAAGISGTPHDMSARGWGSTELCIFCHTPHLAQAVTAAPLWNHASTTNSYTLYSSPTFSGSSTIGQPNASSKLCLSCHDGTVAVDSFGIAGVLRSGTTYISTTNKIGAAASLATDHPISFNYDAALVALDTGLFTPSSTNWVDAAHTVPLFASKMECASCHQAHNNAFGKFLRISNAGSALCLKCHNK